MAKSIDINKLHEIGEGVLIDIDYIYKTLLDRPATMRELNNHLFWHLDQKNGRWHHENIEEFVKSTSEYKDKNNPLEPENPPEPLNPITVGRIIPFGQRAIQDDLGASLQVGLSRFYWLWAWKNDRSRVLKEMDSDAFWGYNYARILAQVDGDFWKGKEVYSTWSGHEELVSSLTHAAYERGLRILWTFIGKPMKGQEKRRAFVKRMSDVLRNNPGVLIQEIMNEPMVGGDISLEELLELHYIAKQNGNLTATGAVWTTEGATSFSPEAWRNTQRDIGICHLDRDQSKSEMQDRPWRQAWDVGLEGMRWIDNEPIGPGSSVNTEDRFKVLRSHRLVAFISRAFATCFHSKAGVRGDELMVDMPGYSKIPYAKQFLPGNLPNGQQQNANSKFPDRHWDVDNIRSDNGKGVVRVYGNQLDGVQYTVAFGPVSDFKLTARYNLYVNCFQQDIKDKLWEIDMLKGESVILTPKHVDYLLTSAT